jgi:uncharacterized protein (TIGR00297 family)
MELALAYVAAGAIGYAGYRARALTVSGAAAACLVGGTIFGFGGVAWAVLLVLFFVASSALSFFRANDTRKKRAAETFEKGGKRDALQVLANGGVPAVCALLFGITSAVRELDAAAFFVGAFVGSLAAATADTWATEIGVLSSMPPRLLTTGKTVPPGTSGGVTWLGSVAAMLGGAFIGIAAAVLAAFSGANLPQSGLTLIMAGLLGGTAGMLGDSLLGATVQASYLCPSCNKPTESRVHHCGTATIQVRGAGWINNDLVNVAGSVVGGIVGAIAASLFTVSG